MSSTDRSDAVVSGPVASRPVVTGLRRLLGLVVALVAIAGVAVFVASALGVVRLVPVLSNSMAPDMPVGSLAVTLPVDQAAVRAGDVIVFTDPDVPERRVIHRVTLVYSEAEAAELRGWSPGLLALTTKGDNNPQADPWIVTIADQRIWREESVVPLLGWPSIALAQPQARFAFFAIGGALVVGAVLVVIWRRPAEVRS
ncbi:MULTISPECIES: signal peptidase I [unclassified Rathayibacter]|uniref:signal peptidase I n=1 Tax=unclassified Rathayibacter TaxID=2609250 RepID=UPI0010DF29EB|nr:MULTISPECIES: signal peptidase I [unclassified Rathayibacter]TCL85855.1 signal peptidase [Rathayibacter sp. PhB192]TCM31676.1 signal peptidase [Rathayibacter sp. PhB179]